MYSVLLVDDDEDYREEIMKVLEVEGYNVIAVEDGEAALPLIRQKKPDIILSNGYMPKMTGVELLRAIKADEELKPIPFVLITGSSDTNFADVARNLGADEIIVKPVEVEALLPLLHKLLKA